MKTIVFFTTIIFILMQSSLFSLDNCNDPADEIDTYAVFIKQLPSNEWGVNFMEGFEYWYDLLLFSGIDDDHIILLVDSALYIEDNIEYDWQEWRNNGIREWFEDGARLFDLPSGHIQGWIDGLPTKNNVESALDWLAANSDANDKIIIYISTHGGHIGDASGNDGDTEADGYDGYVILQNLERYYDGNLHQDLEAITFNNMFLFVNACYSGEFIWDIEEAISNYDDKCRILTCSDPYNLCLVNFPF